MFATYWLWDNETSKTGTNFWVFGFIHGALCLSVWCIMSPYWQKTTHISPCLYMRSVIYMCTFSIYIRDSKKHSSFPSIYLQLSKLISSGKLSTSVPYKVTIPHPNTHPVTQSGRVLFLLAELELYIFLDIKLWRKVSLLVVFWGNGKDILIS